MASCLVFDWLTSAHGESSRFFIMRMSLIRALFPIVSVTSLSFFADDAHHAPQMQENNLFFHSYSSLFIVFPNSGRFSVYISVFLSLVEGDNLPQAAQETTPRNFLCFHVLSHFWAGGA